MDALALELPDQSFDAVWSVEAGPHMPDKQRYADELLRVLRPGGVLAVADWNRRDPADGALNGLESWVMRQLLDAGANPNTLVNNTPRARMREGSPRIVFATALMRAAFAARRPGVVAGLPVVMAVLDGHHDAADPSNPVGSALEKIVRALPERVASSAEAVRQAVSQPVVAEDLEGHSRTVMVIWSVAVQPAGSVPVNA